MDKNLISVDDLVRQRLGGGEEKERAGAWLQMRELLDKEMPQVKGGMYWRRALNAVAVLLLMATVSIGSYKLYSSSNNTGNNEIAAALPVNTANKTNANTTTAAGKMTTNITTPEPNNNETNSVAANSETTDNKAAKNAKSKKGITVLHKDVLAKTATQNDDKTSGGSDVTTVGNSAGENQVTSNSSSNENAKTSGNKSVARVIAGKKSAGKNETKPQLINTNGAGSVGDNKNDGQQKLLAVNESNNTAKNNQANDAQLTTTKKQGLKNKKAGKTKANDIQLTAIKNTGDTKTANSLNNDKPINKTTSDNNISPVTDNKAVVGKTEKAKPNKGHKAALASTNLTSKTTTRKKSNAGKTKLATMNTVALASSLSPDAVTANTLPKTTAAPVSTNIVKTKTALAVTAKNNPAKVKMLAGAATSNSLAEKSASGLNRSSKSASANNKKPTASAASNKANVASKTEMKKAPLPGGGNGNNGMNYDEMTKASAINLKKGKRVIEKMEIYQHRIKNSPESASSERRYHFDTLSVETLTEDLGTADDNNTPVTKKANKKIVPGSKMKDSNTDSSDFALNAEPPASAAEKQADEVKKATGKKKSGLTMIENMQAKFNDIKYNIASVRFAPGITGGINGTFFGPNSFKGFQFGVTGDFILNDRWSIMAALKYVHRVNNSYTMDNNYNTYTYNPAKLAYEKDSFSHPYSFSTLHSFEFPVSVSYTKKSFTFFVGGNFVYTLGVNPSDDPLLAPIPATYVTTPGSNGSAKFTASDIENTRFGIGYLLGFSYKLTSNMLLDLRNVQTVWDNANTAGSRYVSSQLYKSPSLQLSMTYRFGGNKSKE